MSNVRDVGSNALYPTVTQPSTPTTTQAAPTTATRAATPTVSDSAVRVRGDSSAAGIDNVLPPPAAPAASLDEETARGAESFANQLVNVGTTPPSTEAMLAAYLKLQMEGQSIVQDGQNLRTIANQKILGQNQSAAPATTTPTTTAGRPYDPGSDTLSGSGGGSVGSELIRTGTIGLDALLKNQEAQVQLSNDIIAVLGGGRNAQVKRSQESGLEADSYRNDVARLVLDMIEGHQAMNVGKAGSFRS